MEAKKEIEARAKVFWEGGLKTRSLIRGFEVETDKPKSDFGTNTAPAPMEIFIAAMGGCILSTFIWAVWKARIQIEDCTVDIKAYADNSEENGTITKATISLTVWAKKKYNQKLEKCFNIARTTCTLTNAVSFPIESIMLFKEDR
ncbi:MAG: OsmC family protein [Candidatus Heimdallarchaeaceae archaeon]|jgi:uncharacterized OsmC-like protein